MPTKKKKKKKTNIFIQGIGKQTNKPEWTMSYSTRNISPLMPYSVNSVYFSSGYLTQVFPSHAKGQL